jgi:hypothetical protein
MCVLLKFLVFLPHKTMHSYLQNHDFMDMLPSPHEAEKRGFAPQDIFPHKSTAKILDHHALGDGRSSRRTSLGGGHDAMRCPVIATANAGIGGTAITFGDDQVQQFINSS